MVKAAIFTIPQAKPSSPSMKLMMFVTATTQTTVTTKLMVGDK